MLKKERISLLLGPLSFFTVGCTTPQVQRDVSQVVRSVPLPGQTVQEKPSEIKTVSHTETPEPTKPASYSLNDLLNTASANHPRLARVNWIAEAARGQALQAGLYPNPVISFTGDEIGDRTGPAGIWNAPNISQEIVRGGKLELQRAVALKEVDQASLSILAERFKLWTEIRQNYWELVTMKERVTVLKELITLSKLSVENAEKLRKSTVGSELDVVQLEVDLERYNAELESVERGMPAQYQRLAASVGMVNGITVVMGSLETTLPDYPLDKVQAAVLAVHPDLLSAQVGVERAHLALRRAEVEPTPNVTVNAAYTRQSQNRSNDVSVGVSLPLPLWNKNAGGIQSARAQVGLAHAEVERVQLDLSQRVAAAVGAYHTAKARAEKYKANILPKAEKSLALSRQGNTGGQFEYLRVLQAQRAVADAKLEYLKSLGEAWRAASDIAGLMLEDVEKPKP